MAFSLSVLAYLALVLLLAGGPFKCRPGRPGRYLGLAGPLASFLFLPNDSLPPFLDFAWSGPAFWLGLLLGPLVPGLSPGPRPAGIRPVLDSVAEAGGLVELKTRTSAPGLSPGPRPAGGRPILDSVAEAGGLVELKTPASDPVTLRDLLILIPAWLFLCFYAFKRGLPGDLPGFSVFAATPLLSQAGPAGVPGLIGLFLALAPFAAARRGGSGPGSGPGRIITRLAISAFLTTAFFPFNLSGLLETSAPLALGLDFGLFWGKVLFLNRLLAPRLAKARRRFAAFCGAAGLLLLTAEIFWPG